ncbi:hypothetical protein QTI66_39395 [Variovorax sp. J22R133]|nr:hypothetical protein [Variovorax sp. J22R133]MDM0118135.1 hypothetical protein [Variovorax sp. J22R133]
MSGGDARVAVLASQDARVKTELWLNGKKIETVLASSTDRA